MTAVAETFISIAWGVLSISTSLYLLSYFNSPLRDFPGPVLANLTNLWRFLDVFHGRPDKTQLELHRKYGSAVRIGPNVISLSDPSLISKVYTTKGAWKKVSTEYSSTLSGTLADAFTMVRVISTPSMMLVFTE